MSAKDNILKRLHKASEPFTTVQAISERTVMSPVQDADLLELFIEQTKALSANVFQANTTQEAIDYILKTIAEEKTILAWDFEYIPLDGLEKSLKTKDITVADARDGNVRVGITGVDTALAATGSLIISAREGRARTVSLLPYIHIAVVRKEQILPHLDAWLEQQSQNTQEFRQTGNHVVITGASRTADIGMELVLGAHGPADLHIIIL